MIKHFRIQIPLSLRDSFDLLSKCGDDIVSWQTHGSDVENGFLMWKQTLWSLTGKAIITAKLSQVTEKESLAIIEVHKPLQVLDPLKICNRVFRKLDNAVKKKLIENHDIK